MDDEVQRGMYLHVSLAVTTDRLLHSQRNCKLNKQDERLWGRLA